MLHRVPARSTCCLAALIAVGFLPFAVAIDRYPAFPSDEAYFAIPAVQSVEAPPDPWVFHTQAPHAGRLNNYHGPFLPKLLERVFAVAGTSHATCRLPGFAAGTLAIIALIAIAVRSGMLTAALMLAVSFAADRWSHELSLGRPEGWVLLFATAGLILLKRHLRTHRRRWAAAAGFALGSAMGFNPSALLFLVAAAAAVVTCVRPDRRVGCVVSLTSGASVAGLIYLVFLWPDLWASYEQIRWHSSLLEAPVWNKIWTRTLGRGHQTCYTTCWAFAVTTCMAFAAMPRLRRTTRSEPIAILTTMWAIAGIGTVLLSSGYPYYLALLSPFATLGAGLAVDLTKPRRRLRWWLLASFGIALAPSILWKAGRAREALASSRPAYDYFASVLHDHVPADAELHGDARFFIEIHRAGRRYHPLPFFANDPGLSVPAAAFVLLSGIQRHASLKFGDLMNRRPLLYAGPGSLDPWVISGEVALYGPETTDRRTTARR